MQVNNVRVILITVAALGMGVTLIQTWELDLELKISLLLATIPVAAIAALVVVVVIRHPKINTGDDELYAIEYDWLRAYLLKLNLRELDVTVELPQKVENETVSVTRVSPVGYEIEVIATDRMYNNSTGRDDDFTTEWRYELSVRGRNRQVSTRCEVYIKAPIQHADKPSGEQRSKRPIKKQVPSLFYASGRDLRKLCQSLPPLEMMR